MIDAMMSLMKLNEAWKGEVSGSEFTKLYKKQAATREALRK